jgi:hypothetical protein
MQATSRSLLRAVTRPALVRPTAFTARLMTSTAAPPRGGHLVHFRNTPSKHPLGISKTWVNPTINHVWSDDEIKERLSVQPRHRPVTFSDKIAHGFLQWAYKTFNFVTGYQAADPSPDAVAFRLIFLESVAGVPGMVAAQHRHFRSLRSLERDYGWIHTLIEEAENERMHLLTFLQAFEPGPVTRSIIFLTQFGFGSLFISLYLLSPRTAHRLVGYIEEMAVVTYVNLIEMIETPGSKLNVAWGDKAAPDIAKTYWRLPDDASFLDVVKQVAADETNHRDVNHTFASMARDDPNPYVQKHMTDISKAVEYWQQKDGAIEGKDMDYTFQPKQ